MEVSLIVSTYNQPAYLALVLWSYAVQTRRGFEVVVADDGSTADTREMLRALRKETGLRIVHVWQPDNGFQKCEILNRAIVAARGDYLIFTDGDTLASPELVSTHLGLARRDRFIAGGHMPLPRHLSLAITCDDVVAGRVTRLSWLVRNGYRPNYRFLRLAAPRALRPLLDEYTGGRMRWRGNNASVFREHAIAVNGFDMRLGHGNEDAEFGDRLSNLGLAGCSVRFRAPAVHLSHPRPYRDRKGRDANLAYRREVQRMRIVRTPVGITELNAAGTVEV
ncbi:MAG TPA: glycosyltransferase [Gemmatimonadaceae bacterium]|nr:glycosyltransferase [Gemmatimonadaceae bacterium]